jgi:hypothetical protein
VRAYCRRLGERGHRSLMRARIQIVGVANTPPHRLTSLVISPQMGEAATISATKLSSRGWMYPTPRKTWPRWPRWWGSFPLDASVSRIEGRLLPSASSSRTLPSQPHAPQSQQTDAIKNMPEPVRSRLRRFETPFALDALLRFGDVVTRTTMVVMCLLIGPSHSRASSFLRMPPSQPRASARVRAPRVPCRRCGRSPTSRGGRRRDLP